MKRDRPTPTFSTNRCSSGTEVVSDDTGRPVCIRRSAKSAVLEARKANLAAADGRLDDYLGRLRFFS